MVFDKNCINLDKRFVEGEYENEFFIEQHIFNS